MDRLEAIRQHCEGGGPIRRIDMKYLLSEVDRLNALHKREIIVTGEYAQRVIDLTARAEAAEAERDACKADLKHSDNCDICKYTKYDGGCDESDFDCEICKNVCPCATCWNESNWEWRGPQAGKGE